MSDFSIPAATPASSWRQRLTGVLRLAPMAAVLALWGAPQAQAQSQPSPQAIEQAVVKLLKARPELVREALDELQRRETAGNAAQDRTNLANSAKAIYDTTDATVLGNPAGDVTLVEFIDYHCGYCKKLSASTEELIRRDSRLRVVVKHLPILGPDSIAAAQLMLSAVPSAQAAAVHQALMSAEHLDAASLQAIATANRLNPVDTVAANRSLGESRVLAQRLGIQGTPALVLGDTLYRGAVGTEQLLAAISVARSAKQAQAGRKPVAQIRQPAPV